MDREEMGKEPSIMIEERDEVEAVEYMKKLFLEEGKTL